MDGYWFNPRNGKWWVNSIEFDEQKPFMRGLGTGAGSHLFDPPGVPGPGNDWVLILKI